MDDVDLDKCYWKDDHDLPQRTYVTDFRLHAKFTHRLYI